MAYGLFSHIDRYSRNNFHLCLLYWELANNLRELSICFAGGTIIALSNFLGQHFCSVRCPKTSPGMLAVIDSQCFPTVVSSWLALDLLSPPLPQMSAWTEIWWLGRPVWRAQFTGTVIKPVSWTSPVLLHGASACSQCSQLTHMYCCHKCSWCTQSAVLKHGFFFFTMELSIHHASNTLYELWLTNQAYSSS